MGSTTMAFKQILVSVLLGCVAGQNTRTFPSLFGNSLNSLNSGVEQAASVSTTPVPILKFLDVHNNDGSYTYGYESADGSFKIETRSVTGEVSGKYGYIDANGILKETTYGAGTESGFVPVVDGREYNPAANYAANNAPIATNSIDDQPTTSTVNSAPVSVPRRQNSFGNLLPLAQESTHVLPLAQESTHVLPLAQEPTHTTQPTQFRARSFNSPRTKTANGRRVVLKKRVRKPARKIDNLPQLPQIINQQQQLPQINQQQQFSQLPQLQQRPQQQVSVAEQLRQRQAQLDLLNQQRADLARVQQRQQTQAGRLPSRSESPRSFPGFLPLSNPYVTDLNLSAGTYTISY